MSRSISIKDDKCWMCGKKFDNGGIVRTTHHCLPKNLNPVNNILVPICQNCHDRLNSQDVASLTSYGYKLKRDADDLKKGIGILNKNLDNYYQNKNNNKKIKKRK